MKIRFWGTRGSLAKPGPKTVRFGGNTSCVEVQSAAGTRLVIDCGTGAHELGQAIMREGVPSRGHVLISHTHWDHIQGIPFFAPLFVPGHSWDIYAPQGFGESLKETLAGQMEYTYFPVTPEAFGAQVRYHNLGEGSFTIDDLTIRTRYLNHPALTLAFRIEGDGASFAYSCDHEPHSRELALGHGPIEGEDLAHAEFMEGVDLIIHDAQYVAPEYQAKQGWGHSTVEYALSIARQARAGQIALTHHDPARTDDEIDEYLARVAHDIGSDGPKVVAAYEGLVIEIGSSEAGAFAAKPNSASAIRQEPSQENARLLLVGSDEAAADKIARAVADEPVELLRCATLVEAAEQADKLRPSLVLVQESAYAPVPPHFEGAINGEVPTILLGGSGAPDEGYSDRLEEPWSVEYARTRIRTWLMRAECHWARPAVPDDEAERIAALRRLGILDTPPEERFDRHTRIASALFKVPISLVSLIDEDRQWFKSCFGTDVCESSRESSFCAHAVASGDMLIVPDALQDDRFRDNPMVSDGPRIRFYAGALIHSPEGKRIGTLCILDIRPRNLSADEIALLRDVPAAVEAEICGPRAKAA